MLWRSKNQIRPMPFNKIGVVNDALNPTQRNDRNSTGTAFSYPAAAHPLLILLLDTFDHKSFTVGAVPRLLFLLLELAPELDLCNTTISQMSRQWLIQSTNTLRKSKVVHVDKIGNAHV